MKSKHLIPLIFCSVLNISSASETRNFSSYGLADSRAIISSHGLSVEKNVSVGESLIASAIIEKRPAIQLRKEIKQELRFLWSKHLITVPVGLLKIRGISSEGSLYESENGRVDIDGQEKRVSIFIGKDSNLPAEICFHGELYSTARCEVAKNLIKGEFFEFTHFETIIAPEFKKELIYMGGSATSITLMYREFINDMARPAFSQELKYEIAQDPMIGYKEARFEILKATNSSIKFKILRNME